jgi:hypothetical protein
MHSNFITPPDFVDENLTNVVVINATEEQIELLAHMCANNDDQYNIYLYRSEMEDISWLTSAIERSSAVILNTVDPNLDSICFTNKTYYYGDRTIISDCKEISSPLHYFSIKKSMLNN